MVLLNTGHFKRLTTDHTAATERKIQKVLRKIKSEFSKQEYKKLYPTGSAPAPFYGIAKLHKLKNDNPVDDLPIRPIISNINTASHQLAKYLAKILSPLSTSEYTIKSTSDFITHIKGQNVENNFNLMSFNVTSIFTNVRLNFTIDVILKRIYDENKVNTNIPKQQMRDPLLLCAKNVRFSYNGDIYTQTDGVAMGSPQCPVLAGIFMVELERTILLTLIDHMSQWKRYVNDTISSIKQESIGNILSKLNGYHDTIKFTYDMEKDGKLPFLDVLVIPKDYKVETTVYRKSTSNDIYLHWQSFSQTTWKREALQTLDSGAFKVCSNGQHLQNEIKHLKKVLRDIHSDPNWITEQTIEK